MLRFSMQRIKRLPYFHPLQKGIAPLQPSSHLGAKKRKENQHLARFNHGRPPPGRRQDLQRLKDWMDSQNITTLFDISTWGEDKFMSWQGWGVLNRPPDLEREWSTLQLCLQGKAPLKKKGKDERGWGGNAKAYTTVEGHHLIINVPNVMPNPSMWRAI